MGRTHRQRFGHRARRTVDHGDVAGIDDIDHVVGEATTVCARAAGTRDRP